MADKTNWRAILKGNSENIDLKLKASEAIPAISDTLDEIAEHFGPTAVETLDAQVINISYPVTEFPKKIISFNFDKNPIVEGTLLGIKGQYLILDTGVINVRKFTGYEIDAMYWTFRDENSVVPEIKTVISSSTYLFMQLILKSGLNQ